MATGPFVRLPPTPSSSSSSMAPSRTSIQSSAPPPPAAPAAAADLNTAYSLTLLSEYTHTLDSLPIELSRNFADLRELDAVLSGAMAAMTDKIHRLTSMLEQGLASKEERLWLLQEIAEDAARLKLGGEDKIRVAAQAADNLKFNTSHLSMLAGNIPDFDAAATLNRKTVYPHVSSRSYMPLSSMETGRRRRGNYGSLLVAAADPSPAKRKKVQRDDDADTNSRSPRKEKVSEGNARSRARGNKKTDRAASPSESLVSVTSHTLNQTLQVNGASSRSAGGARTNGNAASSSSNKRQRSNQHTNGSVTNDRYPSPYDQPNGHPTTNGHVNGNSSSRRGANASNDSYSTTSTQLPLMPQTYAPNGASHHNGVTSVYDAHSVAQAAVSNQDWNPPLPQELQGPGMPVSRNHAVHTIVNPVSKVSTPVPETTDGGEGDGDGDDRTYCVCNGISYGEMIACDMNQECEREWFHLACIGLSVPPAGQWYCDDCKKKYSKKINRGGKRRANGGRTGR